MKEIKAFAVIDSSSQNYIDMKWEADTETVLYCVFAYRPLAEKYIKAKTEEVKLEIKQCKVVINE